MNIQAIKKLESALVSKEWDNVDSLINYVLSHTNSNVTLEDTAELIKLATTQLSMGVTVRDFL